MIVSAVACLAGLVLSRRPERSLTGLLSPVTGPLALLIGLTVLSIPTSLDPQLSTIFFFKDLLPRVLLGALIVASFWILQPFLAAAIWATMIVVATWPVMLWFQARLWRRRSLAVAAMTVILLLLFMVPLTLQL